jgi:pimeloyl-ACP methyl ester carboxylesterase
MTALRVLCLHGYHGRGSVLRAQLRAWSAGLEARLDLVCVDAPSLGAGDFGWWHAGAPATWARTRDWLGSLPARDDFDGVLGFSQGAALTALVVGMAALPRVRFAVMIGGFVSRDAAHAPIVDALRGSTLPSLHVIGRADRVVPPDGSRALASCFAAPIVLEHDGGHVVPASPAIHVGTARFLDVVASAPTAPARSA